MDKSTKEYRPQVADKIARLGKPQSDEETVKEQQRAEWLAAAEKMTPLERLLQPNPPWLRGTILGDLAQGLDEDELPEVCR